MRKIWVLCALILGLAAPAFAFDHSHQVLGEVLSKSVVNQGAASKVDYGWLKQHPAGLQAYVRQISGVSLREFDRWDEPQQVAFLINSYNALTLKLILTKYPKLDSIKDIGGFFSSPWKQEFFTLLGEIHSLDAVEHQWLRGRFQRPRVHFAIVCASVGCPALNDVPFLATTLDVQLQAAKLRFLGDRSRNRYDRTTQTLHLSKIFDWFADDFSGSAGSVAAFVAEGVTDDRAELERINAAQVKIEFLDYDWSLNKR